MPASSPRRDLVVIFGYVDDTHYYYAHISSTADALHSLIMKVKGSEREVIHLEPSLTPALTGGWQTIRVTHAAAGAIAVFVDDLTKPVMTANDTSYPAGAVALGSFNDRAQFDDVTVSGTSLTAEKAAVEIVADEAGRLWLNYVTRSGFAYQVRGGETLDAFEMLGGEVSGHGGVESLAIDPVGQTRGFYRVVTLFPQLAEP
jgi:hypothetical protein